MTQALKRISVWRGVFFEKKMARVRQLVGIIEPSLYYIRILSGYLMAALPYIN